MNRGWKLLAAAASLCAVVACGGETATDADAGTGGACATDPFSADCKCNLGRDCTPLKKEDAYKWLCTASHRCVRTCLKNADCRDGELCEDAICRPPACGSDVDCKNEGEFCSGGSCKPAITADEVKSCIVLPTTALLHEGSTKDFTVLARDAAGATLAFRGATTWAVEGAGASVKGSNVTGTVTGGNAAGSVKVKATVGGVSCTEATATNFAAAPSGKTRVVVADLVTRAPVSGAQVVMGSDTATTGMDGAAVFDGANNSKKTISVFHKDFAYLTLVDVQSNDVVAFVKPAAKAGKFTGEMGVRAFDELSDLKGTVHLTIYGGSVPGNLIDLQLSSLLGELVPTDLDLGSQKTTVPLPAGTVIGLGEQMFKTKYDILAPIGVRTVWGLGGNADFSAITRALGPVISGGGTENLNIGGVLTSLLPLLGRLQSGVLTGLESKEGAEVPIGDKIKLDTLLRIKADVALPDLPSYQSGTETKRVDGAIVLGGALYSPQGLVPLGITAGLDGDPTKPDTNPPDGKVDSGDPAIPAGTVSMRLAPLHGGLETSKYAVLALAAGLSSLLDSGGDGLVLSGLITFPKDVKYSATEANKVSVGSKFLGFPNPTIAARVVSMDGAVPGASLHRLDIGNEKTGEWSVYFPAGGASTVEIPAVPSGFADRFAPTAASACTSDTECPGSSCDTTKSTCKVVTPGVLIQTVSFGQDTLNYDGVVAFDGTDMDDLTEQISAFSVRGVTR